jgi:hypothetical protein
MKTVHLFLVAGTALVLASCGGNTEKLKEVEVQMTSLKVDTENSTLGWKGSKNPEYFHTGSVKFSKGKADFIDESLMSGNFVVDMTSIKSLDEELPDAKKTMLIGHLSSPEFFDIANNAKVGVKCGAITNGKLPIVISISGKEIKQLIDAKVTFNDGKGSISGTFDVDFSDLQAAGFKPKESGEASDALPVISFDLNLQLK